MTVLKLIEKLEALKEKHGESLEVTVCYQCLGSLVISNDADVGYILFIG